MYLHGCRGPEEDRVREGLLAGPPLGLGEQPLEQHELSAHGVERSIGLHVAPHAGREVAPEEASLNGQVTGQQWIAPGDERRAPGVGCPFDRAGLTDDDVVAAVALEGDGLVDDAQALLKKNSM